MTREASILRVPSFTFFGGTEGAVDHYLTQKGLLCKLSSVEDVRSIKFAKTSNKTYAVINRDAFDFVYDFCFKLASSR